MGASGWNYFVPYQPDINAALQELRQREFAAGHYHFSDPTVYHTLTFAEYVDIPEDFIDLYYSEESLAIVRANFQRLRAFTAPVTIEDLLWYNGPDGASNILDMDSGVAAGPTFGAVAPLTPDQLIGLFGTKQPTRAQVGCSPNCYDPDPPDEDAKGESGSRGYIHVDSCGLRKIYRYLNEIRGRGEGAYFIVYQDGAPSEIYFTGYSGD